MKRGQFAQASSFFRNQQESAANINDAELETRAFTHQSNAYTALGQRRNAYQAAGAAVNLIGPHVSTITAAIAWERRGDTAAELNYNDIAPNAFHSALKYFRQLGSDYAQDKRRVHKKLNGDPGVDTTVDLIENSTKATNSQRQTAVNNDATVPG